MNNYDPDFLDESVAYRAKEDPEIIQHWEAIKLVTHIRGSRERKGLTQAQIAERMGMPQSRVAEIESRPWGTSFSRVLAYARAVGVQVSLTEDVAA